MSAVYEQIGQEAGVRALVDRFYDAMDRRPDCAPIRAMHPADLAESRAKLADFLTGWLGGPQLYVQKHGHPRLRMRHMPFAVDEAARDQWMACMDQALVDSSLDEFQRSQLRSSLMRVADHMRNR